MKKAILAFGMLLMTAPAANAGALTHKLSSSVQLTVDAAATRAVRIGHNFSTSGSGVSTSDGSNNGVVGNSVLMTSDGFTGSPSTVTASQATSGNAFSFSSSYTQGDAIPSAAVNVGDVPNFGDLTSTAAGTGTPTGSITTAGAITVGAGGAGTSAIGQFVSEISIFD